MADLGDDGGGRDGSALESLVVVGQEIRRSNPNAIAVDGLYAFTAAFFAMLAVQGLWPAVIAAFPLVVMLYFAWKSSRLFLLTNLIVIVLAVAAMRAGYIPL